MNERISLLQDARAHEELGDAAQARGNYDFAGQMYDIASYCFSFLGDLPECEERCQEKNLGCFLDALLVG